MNENFTDESQEIQFIVEHKDQLPTIDVPRDFFAKINAKINSADHSSKCSAWYLRPTCVYASVAIILIIVLFSLRGYLSVHFDKTNNRGAKIEKNNIAEHDLQLSSQSAINQKNSLNKIESVRVQNRAFENEIGSAPKQIFVQAATLESSISVVKDSSQELFLGNPNAGEVLTRTPTQKNEENAGTSVNTEGIELALVFNASNNEVQLSSASEQMKINFTKVFKNDGTVEFKYDPSGEKQEDVYDVLNEFIEGIKKVKTIIEKDAEGTFVKYDTFPSPYIVADIPLKNIYRFFYEIENYAKADILLPPDTPNKNFEMLDKNSDKKIRLKIIFNI